jgi:hypothetical protein
MRKIICIKLNRKAFLVKAYLLKQEKVKELDNMFMMVSMTFNRQLKFLLRP